MDEQPFAGLHLSAADDVRPDGGQHLGEGGRLGEVEVIGHGKQLTCGNGHGFGIAAAGEQSRHPVADGPAGDLGAEPLDGAGDLESGNLGGPGWGIVESASLQQVGPIDAGGMDADEDLIGGDVGSRFVGDLQDLGVTGGGDRDSAHASTLVAGCARGQGAPGRGSRSCSSLLPGEFCVGAVGFRRLLRRATHRRDSFDRDEDARADDDDVDGQKQPVRAGRVGE